MSAPSTPQRDKDLARIANVQAETAAGAWHKDIIDSIRRQLVAGRAMTPAQRAVLVKVEGRVKPRRWDLV